MFDRRIHEIDWDAVGDELEKSAEVNDANPMREAVEKLLTHLTIWNASPDNHQPDRAEIESARSKIDEALSRSPSLAGLMELEWKNMNARARFAATLILGDRAALRELLPASRLVLVTDDEAESETESIALMRLSLRVMRLRFHGATNSGNDGDDSAVDHFAWCRAQAAVARSRKFDELDPLGVAAEILGAGNSVRSTLIESLARLLEKLKAWHEGPRSLSLKARIASDRTSVRALLRKNPSLAVAPELMTEAHQFMVREGEWAVVTREPMSAKSSRWTLAQVIDDASLNERDSTFTDARDAS